MVGFVAVQRPLCSPGKTNRADDIRPYMVYIFFAVTRATTWGHPYSGPLALQAATLGGAMMLAVKNNGTVIRIERCFLVRLSAEIASVEPAVALLFRAVNVDPAYVDYIAA